MKRFHIILLSLLPSALSLQPLFSQPLNSIYENNTLVSFEKYIYNTDSSFHTSIRPYLVSDLKKSFEYNQTITSYYISKKGNPFNPQPSASSLPSSTLSLPPSAFNLIFNRNLFVIENKDYSFTIDPLFDFGYGYDFRNDRNTWINTRGFLIEGSLGKDFCFATTFYETQAKVPLWISEYVAVRHAMPGQGWVKGFGTDALDYANASGYVSWSPGKFFNFQLGHGKHFLGDGYRSLMLSDHSLSNLYFMITTTFWKIKYVNLWSQFSHPDVYAFQGDGDPVFAKKYNAMHYLSFIPWKRLNISLFESITWSAGDSTFNRGFEPAYLNPVIFFRPVEFNLGSGDNAMIGINARYTPFRNTSFYGQFVIDEFKIKEMTSRNGWSGNKFAWQLGVKSFDFFGVENLNLQGEVNFIRPYMYSHYNQVQNWSNAREPLAHPSGANIKEAVLIAKYNHKRLFFNAKYVWSRKGIDEGGINYGGNIFLNPQDAPSEYGNYIGQGIYSELNQLDCSISFLVNPSTNANLFVSYTLRNNPNLIHGREYSYLGFGFRTSLRNLYYDFF